MAFSLATRSSSSSAFRASLAFRASSAFRSRHFFSIRSWAAASLALIASSIRACSAAASRWISSRSSSGSESTRTISGFMMVGVMVLASMFWEEGIVLLCLDWKKGILTLPMITIHLISPGTLFHLYFKLRQTSMEPHWFCISSGSRDEILEGGILLHPITLLWPCWQTSG